MLNNNKEHVIMKGEFMSVTEYAELKGITRWYVRKLCREGKIKAVYLGRVWFVNKDQSINWVPAKHDKK